MVKPIEQFAADVWADLPTQDENGIRISRGPLVSFLVIDLLASLFKELLTNGGCVRPNPTPEQLHAALQQPPRRRVIKRALWNNRVSEMIAKQYALKIRGQTEPRECRLQDVDAAIRRGLDRVTLDQIKAAMNDQ